MEPCHRDAVGKALHKVTGGFPAALDMVDLSLLETLLLVCTAHFLTFFLWVFTYFFNHFFLSFLLMMFVLWTT